jgi:putative transposase
VEVDLRRHERPDVKRLQELEAESRRSKEFVAEQALDIDMLRDLAEGN